MDRIPIKLVLIASLGLILAAFFFGLGEGKKRADEEAADMARNVRIENRRKADSLAVVSDSIREVSEFLTKRLEEERAESAEKAKEYEANAARLELAAVRSGGEVREAVLVALGALDEGSPRPTTGEILAIVDRHLEEDRQTNEAFRLALAEKDTENGLVDDAKEAWKARALSVEATLAAREVECESCKREADRWRRIAEPGFLEKFRRGLPWLGGGIAGGIVLVLVLL